MAWLQTFETSAFRYSKNHENTIVKRVELFVVKPLQGCPGIEVVPLVVGFSGTCEVKSIVNDKGWHFCSHYPWSHIQRWCYQVSRDQQPGKGITLERTWCSHQPWVPGRTLLHTHGGCWPPAKTKAGALLCQRSANKSLHPLDSSAKEQCWLPPL